MEIVRSRLGVVQNLGLFDRALRTVIGWVLIAYAAYDVWSGTMVSWHGYAILFAIYPILTAILGYDPLYALVGQRSCDLSERNRCGTLPFEVAAALGQHPACSSEHDCHLETGETRKHQGLAA